MDPKRFRAPFIPKDRIWKEADGLRAKFASGAKIPINVLDMAEFDLGLEIVPADGLRERCDTEAILLGDLKTILVDKQSFTSPKQEYRLRYSVAHELGHYILHREVYGQIRPPSAEAWFEFISNIPDDQYSWLESHAYEFAGRLLVPPDALGTSLREAMKMAENAGFKDWKSDPDMVLDFLGTYMSKAFNVSAEVVSKRLRIEKLWPPS
jgi:IrrE N-terminal-like domain